MAPLRPLLLFVAGLLLLLSGIATALVLRPAAAPAPFVARAPARRCTPATPCLAILFDDVGRDLGALDRLLALDAELTFALLPHAPHTAEAGRRLRRAGRELMLHLPMQPHDPEAVTDEPLVLGPDSPVATVLDECLRRVPGAVGINNHMGSALSTRSEALAALMRRVRDRGLWFADSRTIAGSRVCEAARAAAVPCLARDVFLDDPGDPGNILDRLEEASRLAKRRGWALAIGHPLRETVDAVQTYLSSGSGQVVEVVRLSSIVTSIGKPR